MIRGIDVSDAQGTLAWGPIAAAGIRFAYHKCTEGNANPGIDPHFERNVAAARAAGIAIGAYHYAYPLPTRAAGDGRSAVEQARRAYAACHGLGSGKNELPPMLDLEWPNLEAWRKWGCTREQILDWGLAYLAEAARLWGRKPALYTYPWFWRCLDGASRTDYAAYDLWLADYAHASGRVPVAGEHPRYLAPWHSATVWQHDGDGGLLLPGGHDADFDVFMGDETDFAAFCNAPVPEPCCDVSGCGLP